MLNEHARYDLRITYAATRRFRSPSPVLLMAGGATVTARHEACACRPASTATTFGPSVDKGPVRGDQPITNLTIITRRHIK
jgi:hypothetical protein